MGRQRAAARPRAGSRSAALLLCTAALLLWASGPAEAHYYKTSVASFSTASLSYVDVTGGSLTFTPQSTSEIWVLLFSGEIRSSLVGPNDAEVRYLVNGVEHGMGGVLDSANSGGPWQHFYRVTGTTAVQTIQVQLKGRSGATATIEDLQIIAFRMPSGADFQFIESEPIQLVAGGSWNSYLNLAFTPATAGDYLILSVVNAHEGPSNDTVGVRFRDDALTFWPDDSDGTPGNVTGYFDNGRDSWHSMFLARRQNLTASAKSFRVQAFGGTTNPGSEIQYARIMAFRTDAFEAYESAVDIPESSTTSTTPVLKPALGLTTAAPPGPRDYIVLQSIVLSAAGSLTDARQAGFEYDDVVQSSFSHVSEFASHVSYGRFDAVTTSSSVKYENTFSTSNAGLTAFGKESVIHVLRLPSPCCDLQTSEGSGTITVTAPGKFEMVFDELAGGAIRTFYDLAEDPGKSNDLAGGTDPQGLHNLGMTVSGINYNSSVNDTDPKLALLEATPMRVRVRQESFYEDANTGNRLAGAKGVGDYSVYPSGRTALHWNRSTTADVPNVDTEYLELVVHYLAAVPLASWASYSDTDGTPPNAGTESFLLAQNEVGGARTDFLNILYQNWARSDSVSWNTSVGGERINAWWIDAPGAPFTIPAGSSEAWNFLTYFKPTTFSDNTDVAVTTRRDDYRSPDSLSVMVGGPWLDASENTGGGDDFNEAEATYALTFDPSLGLQFDIDGGTTPRYGPAFKIRQWHSLNDPTGVTLEGSPLVNDSHYRADVMPVSRAHWAANLLLHYTMESQASVDTTPDVGSAGTIGGATSFVAGRYGNGALFAAAGDDISLSSAGNMVLSAGAVEFWYQPRYNYADGARHRFFSYSVDVDHSFYFEKDQFDRLRFVLRNGPNAGTDETTVIVPTANFSWRDRDWVHLRATWDAFAPLGDQVRIFVNGIEPPHNDPVNAYNWATMPAGGTIHIGLDSNGNNPAGGIIDEFRLYSNAGAPEKIAAGGRAANGQEFLANGTRNHSLDFDPGDPQGRQEYLYLGADSKFRGLNIALATAGAGTADLAWEYWNGTAWADLESGFGFSDGTNQLTADGTVSWTGDPFGWAPYSVNGEPDLYYVRVHLASGSYTTAPIEGLIKTDILLFQYCLDITTNSQTFDFPVPKTTAVDLLRFEARSEAEGVVLQWETGSEMSNLGFHVYRADRAEGPYYRLTTALIPGLGSTPEGARYRYLDRSVLPARTYYYELEDVETTGRTKRHGPVSAQASAVPKPGGGTSGDEEPVAEASLTYGEPKQSRFRVLSRTDRSVVIELLTEGFYAESLPEGTVRLSIPGYDEMVTDTLSLPVKRSWIPAVAGRDAHLASIRPSEVMRFDRLRPEGASIPELEATHGGTVRARRRQRTTRELRGSAETEPDAWAKLSSVAFQGDEKKVLVELTPLRWDAADGALVLAKRLEVRLVFSGRDPNDSITRTGRRLRGRVPAATSSVLARLATREPGLYALRYETLVTKSRGARGGFAASTLRLSRQGEPVAYHVEPPGRGFGPGTTLYFVSEGAAANPYGNEAVYELEVGAPGEVMKTNDAPASLPLISTYRETLDREENRYYQAGLLEAPDLWLWDVLVSPSKKSYGFDVGALAASEEEPSRLHVWLQGTSDVSDGDDHHVRAWLNGVPVGEIRWDEKSPAEIEAEIPEGVLRNGSNELELENVGDTGAAYSMVMLDRFRVSYPRSAVAESGSLRGEWIRSGLSEVDGLGRGAVVLDVGGAAPQWLDHGLSPEGKLRFAAVAGHTYLAVAAPFVPEVRAAGTTTLRDGSAADYLAIGPRAFRESARALLDHRQSQGHRVRYVSVEDIYDAFGHGEARPESIRDFLRYAYQEWEQPRLRYVVLLGDGTYDFKDYLGTGAPNLVPPLMTKTSYLWTASDPAYASVNGDDLLPDLAIGRLPAGNEEELERLIAKILAYERHDMRDAPIVLVADNPDRAGDFDRDVAELANGVLQGLPVERIALSQLGADGVRVAVLHALDDGASILSYVGHGGIHLWADENVFNTQDVASLAPQDRQPLALTMNCLNGYFVFPYFDSMAEALVKAEGRGAIAAFSPSGLSLHEPAQAFHRALLEELLFGGHRYLGDAVRKAQERFAAEGALPELLSIYHLFGDPALELH